MPEVIIKYKNDKTLEVLRILSKHLGFTISQVKKKPRKMTIVRGNGYTDNAVMTEIFTKNKFNAKELRSKWQRKT